MGEKIYTFEISALNSDKLFKQVSHLLEKRTELASRARYPGIWRFTDRLNRRQGPSEAGKKGHRRFMLIISIVNLLLGIFLLVPGLMSPKELTVPLIAGAVALSIGILGLCSVAQKKKSRFIKAAKTLLAGKDVPPESKIEVTFSENGFAARIDEGEPDTVPYSQCEYLIEAEDVFLLTFRQRALLLQKRDLSGGDVKGFCEFVSSRLRFVSLN